jgi:hypothetical protein
MRLGHTSRQCPRWPAGAALSGPAAAMRNGRVTPDRRLATVHARYTAAVGLDIESLCRTLKLDTVTVSDRLKSDDFDPAGCEVKALSQPSSCKFCLGLRIENQRLTTTQDAAGDHVPQDRQASEPG